ncbi:MAG: HAMP domain-containing histidine kinase [Nitrospirae bacterium]|nr:HAMP domain-containing histidine kinase [Nitrospirota bacterium]
MKDIDKQTLDFSTMLASAVHDMKNSLGLLVNHLEDVIEHFDGSDKEDIKLLSQLQYEAKRVNNNLLQILSLYRLENSLYALNIAYNPVNDLLDDVYIQNKTLFDYKGISLERDDCSDLCWFFDNDLVCGVVNSILNNTFRYTLDKVFISACEKDGYLSICVDDNGEGYPDYMLEESSIDKTEISFKTGSTGLGIYFSEMVAKVHKNKARQGFISITNGGRYGGGRFCINLP